MKNGNGVWKWIAGILVALMLGGVPGYIMLLRAPTASDFQEVQENQQELLTRIAVLETQNAAIAALLKETREKVDEHLQGSK